MSKMSRATWLLLPFALLLTGCEFDHDHDWGGSSDKFKQDFHMSYPLKPGGRVSVESFNGSVEVLAWDRDEVDISGTKYASTQERLDRIVHCGGWQSGGAAVHHSALASIASDHLPVYADLAPG